MKRTLPLFVFLLSAAAAPAGDVLSWGRPLPADRDAKWTVSYGTFAGIDGHVHETVRAFYQATGQDEKQALAESYSFSDFGVDGSYPAFGVHYEKQWSLFSFRWDLLWISLDADATARRDYYLGLGDEISYGGHKYDHLMISAGTDFSLAFDGVWTTFGGAFAPFTLEVADAVRVTPELDLGLVLIGGQYDIDAGKPHGTTVYQNPPVDFVIGGSSSSFIGAGAPMVGAGVEVRVGPEDWIQWVTRANLGLFSYSGSTKPFSSSNHREKDFDLDFFSLSVDTSVVLPMDDATCFTVGLRLEYMDLDAEIKSKARDAAEIVAARERFDKSADFSAFSAMVYAGITF